MSLATFILTSPFPSLFAGKQVGICGGDPLVKRVMKQILQLNTSMLI